MDAMLSIPWSAHNHGSDVASASFEFDLDPVSAIVQFSLTSYSEHNDQGSVACGITELDSVDGDFEQHGVFEPPVIVAAANNLTRVLGQILISNCSANGVVNIFIWPSVQ